MGKNLTLSYKGKQLYILQLHISTYGCVALEKIPSMYYSMEAPECLRYHSQKHEPGNTLNEDINSSALHSKVLGDTQNQWSSTIHNNVADSCQYNMTEIRRWMTFFSEEKLKYTIQC